MKIKSLCLIATFVSLLLVVTVYAKTTTVTEPMSMIMVTNKVGEVKIDVIGSGAITIDWGYGTIVETHTLSSNSFTHSYSDASFHTITIKGENITHLTCSKNQLTNLNVSKNTVLQHLHCSNNQLTNLDISANTALTSLICAYNQLSSLDVSNSTALKNLYCYGNQLARLNVSINTALIDLMCYDNQLTSLDVSKNINLYRLWCGDNQLTNIDVSKNTALTELHCSNSQLSNIDVSRNTALRSLMLNRNNLSATALNALFDTLHDKDYLLKGVAIINNPGTNDCDTSIATGKGWEVKTK